MNYRKFVQPLNGLANFPNAGENKVDSYTVRLFTRILVLQEPACQFVSLLNALV
jgi:hypothetical protein